MHRFIVHPLSRFIRLRPIIAQGLRKHLRTPTTNARGQLYTVYHIQQNAAPLLLEADKLIRTPSWRTARYRLPLGLFLSVCTSASPRTEPY